jgi:hypothetical protein
VTTYAEPSIGMSNMLTTVQSVSNSKFYFSGGDQHIHNNFFANSVDSNLDAGESLTWFAACVSYVLSVLPFVTA